MMQLLRPALVATFLLSIAAHTAAEVRHRAALQPRRCVAGETPCVAEVQCPATVETLPSCDDGNECTVDRCDPVLGCVHDPLEREGAPCTDGNACTESGRCHAGLCASKKSPACFGNGRGVAVADLNGDGIDDVVLADTLNDRIQVFLGTPNGGFRDAIAIPRVQSPTDVVCVDLTGDGRPEIVMASADSIWVTVLRNTGDGQFVLGTVLAAENGPHAIAAGHLNTDLYPDLVVANQWSSSVSVFLGQGNGLTFEAHHVPLGSAPYDVAVRDIDNDGAPDIVVANGAGAALTCRMGGPALLDPSNSACTSCGPSKIFPWSSGAAFALADLDGDGDLDIALIRRPDPAVYVYRNQGGGTYSAQSVLATTGTTASVPRDVAVLDADGDGLLDIVVSVDQSPQLLIYTGYGTGSFREPYPLAVVDAGLRLATSGAAGGSRLATRGAAGGSGLVMSTPTGFSPLGAPIITFEPPRIISVEPPFLPPGGGAMYVRGQGFGARSVVTIGGVEAKRASPGAIDPIRDSANFITVIVPPGSEGTITDVAVTNPNGKSATLPSAFEYTTSRPAIKIEFMRLVICNSPVGGGCPEGYLGMFKSVAIDDFGSSNWWQPALVAPRSRKGQPDVLYGNNGALTFVDHSFVSAAGIPITHTLAYGLFDARNGGGPKNISDNATLEAAYDIESRQVLDDPDVGVPRQLIIAKGNTLKFLVGKSLTEWSDESATRIFHSGNAARGLTVLGAVDICPAAEDSESFCWDDVAVGDVDGDGRQDLVAASRTGRGHALLLQDENGKFQVHWITVSAPLAAAAPGIEPISDGPPFGSHDIALLDIDGDGDLDLVFSGDTLPDSSPPAVAMFNCRIVTTGVQVEACGKTPGALKFRRGDLLLHAGSCCYGHVGARRKRTVRSESFMVDFNGDGLPDLHFGARAGTGSGHDAVLINRGTADVQTWRDIGGVSSSPFPEGFVYDADYADFDGDGRIDIVVVDPVQGPLVYLNRIPPGAAPGLISPFTPFSCLESDTGDCSAGWPMQNRFWASQYPNPEPPGYPGAKDGDRNGFLDVVGNNVLGVAAGDIDGDSVPDLVIARGDTPWAESLIVYLTVRRLAP